MEPGSEWKWCKYHLISKKKWMACLQEAFKQFSSLITRMPYAQVTIVPLN